MENLIPALNYWGVILLLVGMQYSAGPANLLWGFGGKILSRMMGPKRLRLQNQIYGYLLLGVAIWMLYILTQNYITFDP